MSTPAHYGQLRDHVSRFWKGREVESFSWTLGPIAQTLPRFRVLRVNPTRHGEPWIYVSQGAFEVPGRDGTRFEFTITAPAESPRHIESLAMLANLHADKRYRVSLGDIVDIGRPWVDGSLCSHFLVSLPYPFGPSFERVELGDLPIRIVWLMPITHDEAAFARVHGVEALEQRFDAAEVNAVDPLRRSVVEPDTPKA